MPRLVEYPIDDTVEYILTNSSVGGRASDKARDAMSTLVECSVRSKTFKVKDMAQLLPGDTRSDDAIKTLKIKREGLNSLDAIDETAVPEVISILNGYNAKAKNVQVVANNIRTGKVTVRGGVSETSSHDVSTSAPAGENTPAEAVTEPSTGKDGDGTEKTADAVMTQDTVRATEPATEAAAESGPDDAVHEPFDVHTTDSQADAATDGNDEMGEVKLPDFEAMLKDDAGDGGMFSVDFDDDNDDDDLDDAGSDNEFGDDDGDDVNGYVDEDAPIDIDTDVYRRQFVPAEGGADGSAATSNEDTEVPETASDVDVTAENDGDDASADGAKHDAHHDAIDIDDAEASDEKPENADGFSVTAAPATPDDAIGETIVPDTDHGVVPETEDASSDTDTVTDTDVDTVTDTEEAPDASGIESPAGDSEPEPTDVADAPQDDEQGEATEPENSGDGETGDGETGDGETGDGDDAGTGKTGEKPSEKNGGEILPDDKKVDEIAVFKEVANLHARIAEMKDPQQVQSEFEKLSYESKEALAKFANEQAKEALAKKEAPDTTGGLPEFARELEAEKAAAAAVAEKPDGEPVDGEVEKESGIGEPDIIGAAGEGLDEPDCVSDGNIDYSEENPLVSAMLDKVYDGHGINGKTALVMLDVIFLVVMMIPFSGILNKYICGIDTFSFVGDPLFTFKSIGILALLFVVTRIISLTAQSRAYRKNVDELDGKAERTAYRFYEPGIRAEFMFPSRSFGESIVRSVKSVIAGTALAAATSLCVVDAPVAGMALMAVSIVSIIFLGCRPFVDPEGYTDRMDLSDSTERRIESAIRSNKRKDCWMLSVLFMSFMTCVALGSSMGRTISPIDMFLSPTLSVSIPGFTAFGLAGVLSIAHAFMVTIGMNKKPLSIFWTLIKSAAILFAGLGIGTLFSVAVAFGMLALVLIAVVSIAFYFAGTSSCCKADLPLKRR